MLPPPVAPPALMVASAIAPWSRLLAVDAVTDPMAEVAVSTTEFAAPMAAPSAMSMLPIAASPPAEMAPTDAPTTSPLSSLFTKPSSEQTDNGEEGKGWRGGGRG
jgi:hypothetical protein